MIDGNGQIEQLTNLTSYVNDGDFMSYNWSRDGRYIAAWMFLGSLNKKGHTVDLVIIDTESKQVIDTCISVGYAGEGYGAPPEPIWSPDGNQLLVYNENRNRVILVDRMQGFAAQIAEDMEPLGWMLAP